MNSNKRTDRMFRAFSDETRLRILNLLARGNELCVCDLQSILRAPQPKVSRHLAYLRQAGLVSVRKAGLWKHYSLAKPAGGFHRGLLGCLGGCFAEAGILRKDIKVLSSFKSRGGDCK